MEIEDGATEVDGVNNALGRRLSGSFCSSGTSLSWEAEILTITPTIHAENVNDKCVAPRNLKGCLGQNKDRGHVTFKDEIESEQSDVESQDERFQDKGRRNILKFAIRIGFDWMFVCSSVRCL